MRCRCTSDEKLTSITIWAWISHWQLWDTNKKEKLHKANKILLCETKPPTTSRRKLSKLRWAEFIGLLFISCILPSQADHVYALSSLHLEMSVHRYSSYPYLHSDCECEDKKTQQVLRTRYRRCRNTVPKYTAFNPFRTIVVNKVPTL
jgi:hypothetical protein